MAMPCHLGTLLMLGLLGTGLQLARTAEVQPMGVPDVLDVGEDPDLKPEGQKGPGLWDPLSSFHIYRKTHSQPGIKLAMNSIDADEAQRMQGEVAAMGVLAGHKLLPGTADTVEYGDTPKPKPQPQLPHAVRPTQNLLGEAAPVARKNSLLLAKGTFTMGAASREDGPEEAAMTGEESSFVELGEGPGSFTGDDAAGIETALANAAFVSGGPASLHADEHQVLKHMRLDETEASMVADEEGNAMRSRVHQPDIGETDRAKLPSFPAAGTLGGRDTPLEGCKDTAYEYMCAHWKKEGKCKTPETSKQCQKTCDRCGAQSGGLSANAMYAVPKPKNPNDCVVGKWDWSTCTDNLDGEMGGSRKVIQKAKEDGAPCPSLIAKVGCNSGGCHRSCRTCSGPTENDCLSCYASREDVLNAQKMTNNKNTTYAWKPDSRREMMLMGEGGYQFKMLSIKKLTGQCVWEGDIATKEVVSVDGSSKCTLGCDPPALMGQLTPGFVCTKTCTKTTWSFEDVPNFGNSTELGEGLGSKIVFTGKAAKPSCETRKAISCAPVREKASKEKFSGDSKMKCTVRKSGRCTGVRYGTYKLHKTVKVQGKANVQFLLREYNTKVASTCEFDSEIEDYKNCQPGGAKSEADAMIASQTNPTQSDKAFIDALMQAAFADGWSPLTLLDGARYFAKFELDSSDSTTYGCKHNDACQQAAAMN